MTNYLTTGWNEHAGTWERGRTAGCSDDRGMLELALRAGLSGFARWFTSARVFGMENLMEVDADRPRVYVANHTSHGDFLLLWASLPPAVRERARPVAAADYWECGFVRQYLARRVFRSVLVSRNHVGRHHHPMAAMLRAVEAGDSLILFPEGTRGNGVQLQEFRCGVHHLLQQRPDLSVVPVWLEGLDRAFPRGSVVPLPLPCAVAFGEEMVFDAGQEKHRFLEGLRTSVERLGEQCRQRMRES